MDPPYLFAPSTGANILIQTLLLQQIKAMVWYTYLGLHSKKSYSIPPPSLTQAHLLNTSVKKFNKMNETGYGTIVLFINGVFINMA